MNSNDKLWLLIDSVLKKLHYAKYWTTSADSYKKDIIRKGRDRFREQSFVKASAEKQAHAYVIHVFGRLPEVSSDELPHSRPLRSA